ncbi:MAG TPA: hypothetical protein VGM90_21375 [Kofleriaceae bacterium]|jgi:hypothetical protein
MKKLALGALIAGLAACGGGGGSNSSSTIIVPDGNGDDGGGVVGCSPTAQTGCNANEKCTWINDQDDPPIGHIGCAPDGNIAIGSTCTEPAAGPMGYDTCAKGSYCISGECKQICDNNGGTPACDGDHSCTIYDGLFESSGSTVAGVCDPGCDPLTQDLKIGTNKVACGSTMATMPNKGCYGFDDYSCAPVPAGALTLTDRQVPKSNASGNAYLNGCAPGFIPFFFEMTGSTKTLCSGLCAALESDNTKTGGTPATTPLQKAQGDAAALGKLPGDATAVAGHATCLPAAKGSNATASRCLFIWPFVQKDDGTFDQGFQTGPYFDKMGVCMDISKFQYDMNGDMTPDTAYPGCESLPPRSATTTQTYDDAADWGCYTFANTPMTLTADGHRRSNPVIDNTRMPKNAPMMIVRHQLL